MSALHPDSAPGTVTERAPLSGTCSAPSSISAPTSTLEPDQVGLVQEELADSFGLEGGDDGFQSDSVGPTFGEQIARSAGLAIVFSLLLILAYVAFRFEAKYAIPVMIAVIHDILITAGGQETNADGQNTPPGPGTQRWARLIELTHDQPAEKVWEMRLQADDSNWSIYRAERLPGVYP